MMLFLVGDTVITFTYRNGQEDWRALENRLDTLTRTPSDLQRCPH